MFLRYLCLDRTAHGESRLDHMSRMRSRTDHEHWGRFQPDDDEMRLTTIITTITAAVHVSDKERNNISTSELSQNDSEEREMNYNDKKIRMR